MKVSNIISSQLPNFISGDSDYSQFVKFLEAYYEWMEQKSGVLSLSESMMDFMNIDKTLDQFIDHFYQEIIPEIPKHIAADKRKLIHFIKEFYRSKGTKKSYKFLFRALYDSDCEITETNDFLAQPSSGLWYNPTSIKLKSNDERFLNTEKYFLYGESSKTFAKIERVNLVNGRIEIFLAEIKLLFNVGEFVKIVDHRKQTMLFDQDGISVAINGDVLRSKLYRPISNIEINQKYRGNYYSPNNPVIIHGGLDPNENSPRGAKAVVGDVNMGYITSVIVDANSCLYGYRKPESIVEVFPDNNKSTIIEIEEVDESSNVLIKNVIKTSLFDAWFSDKPLNFKDEDGSKDGTDYYNFNTKKVDANSTLDGNSFDYYDDIITHKIKSVMVDNGGGGFSRKPELFVYGMYPTDAPLLTTNINYDPRYDIDTNNYPEIAPRIYNKISDLGILAPIAIEDGGSGYSEGDEIIFSITTLGEHAYARVTDVDEHGKITAVDYYIKDNFPYPNGGHGYTNDNLPTVTVKRNKYIVGNISTGSDTISFTTNLPDYTKYIGATISADDIPVGTTITHIFVNTSGNPMVGGNTIRLSKNAIKDITGVFKIIPIDTTIIPIDTIEGNISAESNIISFTTNLPDYTKYIGATISADGIPVGTTITNIVVDTSSSTITLSKSATIDINGTFTISPIDAKLYVPGIMGGSAKLIPISDRIGSINSIKILEYGEDYIKSPTISLRIEDFFVQNIDEALSIPHGSKISNTFYKYFSMFDSFTPTNYVYNGSSVSIIRVYDYNKSIFNVNKNSLLNQIYLEFKTSCTCTTTKTAITSPTLSNLSDFSGYKITCEDKSVLKDNTTITNENNTLTLSQPPLTPGTFEFTVYFPITTLNIANEEIISSEDPNAEQNSFYNEYLYNNGMKYDLNLHEDKLKYDAGVITYGDGSAKATAGFKNGIIMGVGRYLSERGNLGSSVMLQNNRYNDFSYFLDVEVELLKYKRLLKDLLHPAGINSISRACIVDEPDIIPSKFEVGSIDKVVHIPLNAIISAEPNSVNKNESTVTLTGSVTNGSNKISIDKSSWETFDNLTKDVNTASITWKEEGASKSNNIINKNKKDYTLIVKDKFSITKDSIEFTISSADSSTITSIPIVDVEPISFDNSIKISCKKDNDNVLSVSSDDIKKLTTGMTVFIVIKEFAGSINKESDTIQVIGDTDKISVGQYIIAEGIPEKATVNNIVNSGGTMGGGNTIRISSSATATIYAYVNLTFGSANFNILDYKFKISAIPQNTTIKTINKNNTITLTNDIKSSTESFDCYFWDGKETASTNDLITTEDLSA